MEKKINIILYEPEIPQNVGSVIRICVAINAKLHIIEPLGFIFDNRFIKRSSANYIKFSDFELYDDLLDFNKKNKLKNLYFATRYGKKIYTDINFFSNKNKKNIYIMFGKESSGIPYNILKNNLEKCFRIPMHKNVRSLNLSCAVSIISYEIMRQLNFLNLSFFEVQKGKNFLKK